MKARLLATIIAMAMLAGLTLAAAPASAATTQVTNQVTNIPVTGTCENTVTGETGTFTGTLSITRFATQGNKLVATGTLSGTCSAGGTLTNQQVTMPVRIAQASCQVLKLVLGPLHLEVLGLVVDLNRVVLTITAEPGGGILGDLLCALAGQNTLQQIVDLLNQILAILQGLGL